MKCTVRTGTKTAGLILHEWFSRRMRPYGVNLHPGTLNLIPGEKPRLNGRFILLDPDGFPPGRKRVEREGGHYSPRLYPARIEHKECWVFMWGPDFHTGELEVVAEEYLREALNLKDGDTVTVELQS